MFVLKHFLRPSAFRSLPLVFPSARRQPVSSLLAYRPTRFAHSNTMQDGATPKKQKKIAKSQRETHAQIDDVLQTDIERLLKLNSPADDQTGGNNDSRDPLLPERFSELTVTVTDVSCTGDGLALSENKKHVYVVPFTVPGDKVLVKIARHNPSLNHSVTDFIRVVEPGPTRNDALIGCQYFGRCSGCQLQMISYEDQLAHKRRIVEKAYANFSGLIPEIIPTIGETFPSPMQYGYRTKLSPHFANPKQKGNQQSANSVVPPIGFTLKNRRLDLDIEDCPLGTDIVRRGLKSERKRVAENIRQYKRGATLLMRESTSRIPKDPATANPTDINKNALASSEDADTGDVIRVEHEKYIEEKRCITDNNATAVEYVDDYVFSNKAGSFFQNNNSILPGFTEYIRSVAIPPGNDKDPRPIKYLLDAYSGSGLFTITLSPLFRSSLGVDVSADSIVCARKNAQANSLPSTGFAAADAAVLFQDVPYPPDQTLLVIDPPRKGCSQDFLDQLLSFQPRRVVYVSCNVHTQARDVGTMVQGDEKRNIRYDIESIRGFDFFPQTGHVEGVAILNRTTFAPKTELGN